MAPFGALHEPRRSTEAAELGRVQVMKNCQGNEIVAHRHVHRGRQVTSSGAVSCAVLQCSASEIKLAAKHGRMFFTLTVRSTACSMILEIEPLPSSPGFSWNS